MPDPEKRTSHTSSEPPLDRAGRTMPSPSRRALLAAGVPAAALFAAPVVPARATPTGGNGPRPSAPIPQAPTPQATGGPDLALSAGDDGKVVVSTADGADLVRLGGYRIGPEADAREGTVERDEQDGDVHILEVRYELGDPDHSASVVYRQEGPVLTAEWTFDAPEDADLSVGRIYRVLLDSDVPDWSDTPISYPSFPVSRWEGDPDGGVPIRVSDDAAYFNTWQDGEVEGAFVISGSNASAAESGTLHAPPTQDEDGTWTVTYLFRVDDAVAEARKDYESGAQTMGSAVLTTPAPALAVDLWHRSTFRLFEQSGKHTFQVGVFSAEARDVRLTFVARSLDGEVITKQKRSLSVEAATVRTVDIDVDLPGPRCYAHLEATVEAGKDVALVRSGAAVVPPHEFGPAEQTIIGMGGYSTVRAPGGTQLPTVESQDDEIALWQRMGVRHLRNNWLTPEQKQKYGITTAYQPAASPEQFAGDAEGFEKWLDRSFELGQGTGATHYELLNEWNLRNGGIGVGYWAEEYTKNFLLPFRKAMDERGIDAKLTSLGLGSWDPQFMDGVRENGGWDALDGVAIHPGRGNFAADYDPVVVDDIGDYGEVWNFYGATRRAKAYVDEHGPDKELWITELNAMTCPNRWWNDDERIATDSTFLVLTLAKAVGVTGLYWFENYDSVYGNKYGVDPENPEFHFGLIRTDRSPKPSLLAFIHAAELLDGAAFDGFVESPHPDLHGLRFTNDDGPFWILWSRQDGYINWADHEPPDTSGETPDLSYPFPEPWERHERKHLRVRIPAADDLAAVDVIGRDVKLGRSGKDRTVQVGASPVVVRGGIAADSTGPEHVSGTASLNLKDVSVRRTDGGVEVSGVNRVGAKTELHVETAPAKPQVVQVPRGEFTVTVKGDMADGDQVRVFAERRKDGQLHRAEYYRTV
jgi:hypothetical protein